MSPLAIIIICAVAVIGVAVGALGASIWIASIFFREYDGPRTPPVAPRVPSPSSRAADTPAVLATQEKDCE